ncbi:hypothetical protein HanPSC8_Chr10g0409351 [Helianthus annuus]|nr:hypothetical protein HanPSC8_Chr10g0409351 [Helianthus annuus]
MFFIPVYATGLIAGKVADPPADFTTPNHHSRHRIAPNMFWLVSIGYTSRY